jgi:hypothetical protein
MTKLNLLRPFGCWTRLMLQARLSHSLTKNETAEALRAAVIAMKDEQRAEGLALGLVMCEYDDCPCEATHSWVRSAADLKAIRRKYKGVWLVGQPSSTRCESHVPGWLVPKYRPFGRRAEQLAA